MDMQATVAMGTVMVGGKITHCSPSRTRSHETKRRYVRRTVETHYRVATDASSITRTDETSFSLPWNASTGSASVVWSSGSFDSK